MLNYRSNRAGAVWASLRYVQQKQQQRSFIDFSSLSWNLNNPNENNRLDDPTQTASSSAKNNSNSNVTTEVTKSPLLAIVVNDVNKSDAAATAISSSSSISSSKAKAMHSSSNTINYKSSYTNKSSKKKTDASEYRERSMNMMYFYTNPEIDKAIQKPLVRLNPMTMMYMGVSKDNSHILQSANYLRKELPIRLAHMIKDLRALPFIVGCNPSLLEIHERCIKTFKSFNDFDKDIKDLRTERRFNKIVFEMLEMNKDLLALLCDGFRDSRRYIKSEEFIKTNVDKILSSRLGIRLLCEHHIALNKQSNVDPTLNEDDLEYNHQPAAAGASSSSGSSTSKSSGAATEAATGSSDQKNSSSDIKEDWVGIINKKFSPKKLIETSGRMVSRLCMDKYGQAPRMKIDGHTNAYFPYIQLPLEYILPELLKNSYRATYEHHRGAASLPDVNVTIAINDRDCIIRIRDRGGGIPHNLVNKIFDYHFTTATEETNISTSSATSNDSTAGFGGIGDYFNLNNNIPKANTNQLANNYDNHTNANLINSNSSNSNNEFMEVPNEAVGMLCQQSSNGLAVMHGYGFGLPTSKAYAEYLGGSLSFQSMQGIGCDFYLRLALLDIEPEMVRI